MEDPGVTERQIKYGSFLARNRATISKVFRWIAIAFSVIVLVIFGITMGRYGLFAFRAPTVVENLAAGSINYDAVKEAGPPTGLAVRGSDVFKLDGVVDILAEVENPNEEWAAAEATYVIEIAGREIEGLTQVLPGELKYIGIPNIDVGTGTVGTPKVKFTDIIWERVKDPLALPQENWVDKDSKHVPVSADENENEEARSIVTTTVSNRAVVGFKEVEVMAILEQSGEPVGFRIQRVGRFESFESKDLQFTWPKRFAVNVKPSIQVDTNVLEENNVITVVQ